MSTAFVFRKTGPDRFIDMSGVASTPGAAERCTKSVIEEAVAGIPGTEVRSVTLNTSGIHQPPRPEWSLPEGGGSIAGHAASEIPPITDLPDFCEVVVRHTGDDGITSVVTVWVPLAWNGRLGTASVWMPLMVDSPHVRALTLPAALRNGFATASSDGGYRDARLYDWAFDAESGEFDEALLRSWAYGAIHPMVVIAKAVTTAVHGRPPEYSYMAATSTGGKQVVEAATRYPDDFDGLLCVDSAVTWSKALVGLLWPSVVMRDLGNPMPAEKLERFRVAAIEAADGLDGLRDGFLGALDPCDFAPRSLVGEQTDAGPITELDAETMRLIWDGPRRSNGERLWHGFRPGVGFWLPGHSIPVPDSGDLRVQEIGLMHLRWVTRDPAFDWTVLTRENFEEWFDRSVAAFGEFSSDDADLTVFRDRGGKIVFSHAGDDGVIPSQNSVDFYDRLCEFAGGLDKAASFARLFVADGDHHSFSGGPGPGLNIATGMTALMNWVENDSAPESLTGERYDLATGELRATRPVFPYPSVTRYSGSGDPKDALSYVGIMPPEPA
ncbi:tannase/feruloyl esterase family alpha/beta hydrolase [Streptomyces sp. NPDC051985]|uniref:tannase/feruloyl esterase family alpha/beta hydrolase n=1 Tax=Streptomyces sp. NPDC051985 TaxID=3155807 RepID=UPI003412C776